MSDQTETESVSHNAMLAIGVCLSTDSKQSIYGSGGSSVEPNGTHTSAPDGTCGGWGLQTLAHGRQYQQHDFWQQQQQCQQYQYQQQMQSALFQYGTGCQIPDRSKTGTLDLSAPAPQVGVPWTQSTTQSDPGQYETQDLYYNSEATIYNSERQQVSNLPDPYWSIPSASQSTLDMRSDYGTVKR
jgi:hypothetical protein